MKTLEEAAFNFTAGKSVKEVWSKMDFIRGAIFGANWQAKRMYSEEDMIEFAKWTFLEVGSNTGKDRTNKELFNEWFEQFKKK